MTGWEVFGWVVYVCGTVLVIFASLAYAIGYCQDESATIVDKFAYWTLAVVGIAIWPLLAAGAMVSVLVLGPLALAYRLPRWIREWRAEFAKWVEKEILNDGAKSATPEPTPGVGENEKPRPTASYEPADYLDRLYNAGIHHADGSYTRNGVWYESEAHYYRYRAYTRRKY